MRTNGLPHVMGRSAVGQRHCRLPCVVLKGVPRSPNLKFQISDSRSEHLSVIHSWTSRPCDLSVSRLLDC